MPNVLDNDNPDLTVERNGIDFDQEILGHFFWGQRVHRRKEIADYVELHADELRSTKPLAFMSREESLEAVARLSVAMLKHAEKALDMTNFEELFYFNRIVCGDEGAPFFLHFIMAIPAILNNADDEQQAEWLPKLYTCQLLATYAQTELGHGTNLSKLEITATYDPESEQFVLDSPTITATKWWPGNLGKSSNHAIVVANLYTRDKCYGPHLFWVQIRDIDTHMPLRGITVGDIGPKFGINTNDNGFLRFDKVHIPRRHMLMKYAKVLPNGEFVHPNKPKTSYLTMMFVRSSMIRDQAYLLAKACTIAIRYSCVRRQGELREGAGEVKILDYQTQQYRLFPQMARAFAMMLAGSYCYSLYQQVQAANVDGNDSTLIQDTHSLSSGLKSVCSFQTALGIEQCRMACGGHGYSQASGFPLLYTVAVGGCTYEGENIVMLLQGARYLMKCAAMVRKPSMESRQQKTSPIMAYLFQPVESKSTIKETFYNGAMTAAFDHLAQRLVLRAYDQLESLNRSGKREEAWNETSIELTKATRAHTRAFMARNFVNAYERIKDVKVSGVVSDILKLYLCYEMLDCSAALLEDGFISAKQLDIVRVTLTDTLKMLRRKAVMIVDSLGFTDADLNSVIGRKDGQVYENLMKWAMDQPINQYQVLPFHEKYIGKAMKEARIKNKSKI